MIENVKNLSNNKNSFTKYFVTLHREAACNISKAFCVIDSAQVGFCEAKFKIFDNIRDMKNFFESILILFPFFCLPWSQLDVCNQKFTYTRYIPCTLICIIYGINKLKISQSQLAGLSYKIGQALHSVYVSISILFYNYEAK